MRTIWKGTLGMKDLDFEFENWQEESILTKEQDKFEN